MDLFGLLFVGIGLFAIAGAWFDWDWFMNARKARFWVKILTRNGARIFYACLGIALFVFGIFAILGIIDLSN